MQKSKSQFKIKNFLTKYWPIIFIVAVWLLFSYPYFLQGRVPYASTYQVNFFPPWSHYEKFASPIKNNAMPDVHTQIYPWKKFTIDTFESGEIPFWNPYSFAGTPHLANVQSAILSPLNTLFLILPFIDAWSILVLLQPLLAGLFTYLFVREIGVSRVGSLISTISFMFCGFIVVWMAYGTLAYAILYLPLALFAIERYGQTQRKRFLALLTLTIPLSFFSGHFQISLYFFATVIAYTLYKGIVTKKLLVTSYLLLVIALGLALSLPQLLPSIEFYRNAVRSEIFVSSETIPLQYLISIIAPDFFGNPVTRNDWFGHYAEWAGFIGIWPLILAIYAILKVPAKGGSASGGKSFIVFFTALGLLSLALAVNSPLSSYVVSLKIPVISTSALSRIIVLFSFSFAVLAGFGLDRLLKDIRDVRANKSNIKKIIGVLTAAGVFFALTWLLLLVGKVYPDEWLIVVKRNLILPTALFIGGAGLILASTRYKKLLLFTICYLPFAISFDSFRFAQKWMPFDPKELVYPNVPVISALKENIDYGRVFGNLGGEVTVYYNIPMIEGYDPLYIGRYGEFIRTASAGEFTKGERSVVRLARDGKYTDRVLDLLGVTTIFHPIPDTNQGWAYPVWREDKGGRYTLVYKDSKHELYKNNFALPRALPFYDFEVIGSDQEMIRRFYSDEFDFRKKLIVEEEIKDINNAREGTGSAKIISYVPNKVAIEVNTTTPALLFLSDNYYPGWKAFVNGKEAKIYRADYTFRAIVVPAGESIVEFKYEISIF